MNAIGHKCTFRRNIEQSQIDDMLAKLITAMTKEGKFKDSPFIRCFHSLLNSGGSTFRRMLALKKVRPTDRPMTTPLFLLRCVQLGISIRDLDLLTIGLVNDMYAENSNDDYKGYKEVATQEDFDKF